MMAFMSIIGRFLVIVDGSRTWRGEPRCTVSAPENRRGSGLNKPHKKSPEHFHGNGQTSNLKSNLFSRGKEKVSLPLCKMQIKSTVLGKNNEVESTMVVGKLISKRWRNVPGSFAST